MLAGACFISDIVWHVAAPSGRPAVLALISLHLRITILIYEYIVIRVNYMDICYTEMY